jgi:large repetitive protein
VTLPAASQPFGVVISPVDGNAWVALQASGEVVRIDGTCGTVLDRVAVGADARHLAMPATGDRLLVSRFISPPLPDESTTEPKTSLAGVPRGGEVIVVDAASRTVSSRIVVTVSERSDTSLQGRGIPNYLGAAAISPDGASAWLPSKQDNVMRGVLRDGNPLDHQNTVRAISSRLVLGPAPAEDPMLRIDHDNSGLASAAAFSPSGRHLFVALETSRQIALVDPFDSRELMRIEAGLAPQGVAVSDDGRLLAVNNFMSRTAGLYDLSDIDSGPFPVIRPLVAVTSVTTERLSPVVLAGKQLFYDARDPRLSRDAYLSCASCHNDGDGDGRVWDLASFGEGLRNTISLRGRGGAQFPLHWSGNFDEIQDFEGQIRDLAQGTGLMSDADYFAGTRRNPLGDPTTGLSPDLDALAAYVASLDRHQPSPHRNADRTLTASAVRGKALFSSLGCASCHGGSEFAGYGAASYDIGTLKSTSGQRLGGILDGIDTPTLRDVWANAPYLHDGSAATVADAIRAHTRVPAIASAGAAAIADVADYVMQIGSEE